MTKKNTIYYEELCSLGELMDRQYNLYDEGLCNAENTLNYFKYLRENNKLEICTQYLLDMTRSNSCTDLSHITRPALYAPLSNLEEILYLAVNSKESALIKYMQKLAPNLTWNIIQCLITKAPDPCSEEYELYSNILGASPEE